MCALQSVTNIIDNLYLWLLGLLFLALVYFTIHLERARRYIDDLTGRERRWYRPSTWPRDDEPSDRDLRGTRYAWLIPARRSVIIAGFVLILYPMLSPTFCVNFKCAPSFPRLHPNASCATTGAVRPDHFGVTVPKSIAHGLERNPDRSFRCETVSG